jgi:hypothetical protein
MTRQHRQRPADAPARRRGIAALFVLVCLSFATVVGTLLMQAVVAERADMSRLALRHQAECLLDSGVDRAIAQLARSSVYRGETWSISSAELPGAGPASVHIDIKPDPANPNRLRLRVTTSLRSLKGPAVEAAKELNVITVTD